MCSHNPNKDYFYSVYSNSRICRFCWTEEASAHTPHNVEEESGALSLVELLAS